MITEQDATSALGADPGPGQLTELLDGATACSYLAGQSVLQVSVTPSGGRATFQQESARIADAAAGTVAMISGVGDEAFAQYQGSRGAINFDKGDVLVVVALNLAGATDPPREQLVALASAAAGRL